MNIQRTVVTADLPRSSIGGRLAIALVAAVVSSTLIGGVLGLFEMQSGNAAIARAHTTDARVLLAKVPRAANRAS